jgi:hypothetical protein
MDKKKLVIIILVVIGILALMALVAGVYRSKTDSPPDPNEKPGAGMRVTEALTGWMRSKFDLSRLGTCNGLAADHTIRISNQCIMTIAPGSVRPSSFKLEENSSVNMCFALTRPKLSECIAEGAQSVDEPVKLTVAKDSAFIFFQCAGGTNDCAMVISDD